MADKNTRDNQIAPSDKALSGDYTALLHELKSILSTGLNKAYKAVDNLKVQTYWQIGERIVREELQHKDRAEYGKHLIEKLAVDLGMQKQRLHEIVQFHNTYPIVRSLTGQLSWTHYTRLIAVSDDAERRFYEQKSIQNAWSVRTLRDHIKSDLYAQTSPKEIQATSQQKLPDQVPSEIFKNETSDYDFGFFPLGEQYQEKDIEDAIVSNIEHFLTELGDGFCFVGRQVPMKMDGKTHTVDLVLFHKGIPCTILVDLKSRGINSQDIGQMNKYVSYWRKNCQYGYEQDAIGLILSTEINREEVAYALEDLEKKIFVATYKTLLPSDEQLKQAVKTLNNKR